MLPGFTKLFTLGDRNTKAIFDNPVEITEKVDGSAFNFGRVEAAVKMRSKNVEIFFGDDNKMFNKAKDFIHDRADVLPEGIVFHGEYLRDRKQNTLLYDRVPKNHFVLFGMTLEDGAYEDEYDNLAAWSRLLECDVVPLLYKGDGKASSEFLDPLLYRESFLGGCKQEGIVIKNYMQTLFLGGVVFPIIAAKYVSADFKETHKVSLGASHLTPIEKIQHALKTEARWQKAIQHLRDSGKLTESTKDIGPLLMEINRDVLEEEKEEIKDALFKLFWKDINRGVTNGFPEWYKKTLSTDTFAEQNANALGA